MADHEKYAHPELAWLRMVELLLPLAKGYVAVHPNIESTRKIIDDAEQLLIGGQP